VLVVDDDEGCRDVLASVLEVEGYLVTTAANGLDAIRAIDLMPEPPDAIVLDLMMPIMNGWEFLEALETRPGVKPTPILVTSASHDPRVEGLDVRFLRKPVDLEEFLSHVAASVADRERESITG
jgi:CheY-like chemotaxis protein